MILPGADTLEWMIAGTRDDAPFTRIALALEAMILAGVAAVVVVALQV